MVYLGVRYYLEVFHDCEHSWSEPFKGMQACERCGLARYVEGHCRHKWERNEIVKAKSGLVFVMRCRKCGILYQEVVAEGIETVSEEASAGSEGGKRGG